MYKIQYKDYNYNSNMVLNQSILVKAASKRNAVRLFKESVLGINYKIISIEEVY